MRLQSLTINIYGHKVVATQILRLRLTVQIQKLKYLVKSLEHKSTVYSFGDDIGIMLFVRVDILQNY